MFPNPSTFHLFPLLQVVSLSLSFVGVGNYTSGEVFIASTTLLQPTHREAKLACINREASLLIVEGTPTGISQLLSFVRGLKPLLSSGAIVFEDSSGNVSTIRASKYGFTDSTGTEAVFLTICRRSKLTYSSMEYFKQSQCMMWSFNTTITWTEELSSH